MFAQNNGCGYTLEPPFWIKNKKNRRTPANSSFLVYKRGVQGGILFMDMYLGSFGIKLLGRTCRGRSYVIIRAQHVCATNTFVRRLLCDLYAYVCTNFLPLFTLRLRDYTFARTFDRQASPRHGLRLYLKYVNHFLKYKYI